MTYFTFKHLSVFPELRVAVFTRLGGISFPPYESLNLGIHINDNKNHVIENRKKALHKIDFSIDNLIAMEQVHSDNLEVVTYKDCGRGAYSWEEAIPSTDGMICPDRGTVLMAVVADCSVTVFYCPEKKVIAIAHCGWRGTVKKLSVKVIKRLKEEFNCHPSSLYVGICPSIGSCCCEVGTEVYETFHDNFSDSYKKFFKKRNGKLYLDLKKALIHQLLDSGVCGEYIETIDFCTACRTDLFFSHRAELGKTGRTGVFIGRI